MKPFQRFILSAIFCAMASGLFANALTITGLTISQNSTTGGTVSFTVTWNNCWNLSSSTAPNNWDAAWIFVKWRNCSSSEAVPFTQGQLSTTMSQHTIPSSLQAMTSYPSSGYLTGGGSTVINSGSGTLDDPNGIMLSPTTSGTQTSVTGSVTLYVTNLPSNANTITVDVIGIEMVYVPQGPFNLGDGSTSGSSYNYHFCTSAASASPALVSAAYETAAQNFFYMSGGSSTPAAYVSSVPAAFPKGYYAYYCMKYEITEDLYNTFLNTIGSSAAQNRFIGNYGTNRQYENQTNSYTFTDARPYRVQNFMSYGDWLAILDWSCLRPMTELEFEKACRGGSSTTANGAMANEYPWQSTTITIPTGAFTLPGGYENGTETLNGSPNCNAGNVTFTNGDGVTGPVRAGIFATSTTGQQSAGATYFGIMEMGGNVREFVVELSNTVAVDTYTRVVGDGVLVTIPGNDGAAMVVGDALEPTWPYPETGNPAANGFGSAIGQRGGDWYTLSSYMTPIGTYPYEDIQTSARDLCYYTNGYQGQPTYVSFIGSGRYSVSGGRGVR